MKRAKLFTFCLFSASVLFFVPRLFAVEIAPATAKDITEALGPDARGLNLSQDVLPDLFALTASRIEENSKSFTVVEPYMSGRWKGGRVVIEYARDLSYTLVSVYDKEGQRQRIYSVRTSFTDHVTHQETQAVAAKPADTSDWGNANSPSQEQSPSETQSAASRSSGKSKSSSNSSPRSTPTTSGEATAGGENGTGFEWDEASGSYVPVGGSATEAEASAETPKPSETKEASPTSHHRRKHHNDETVVASARMTPTPATPTANALPAPMQDSGIWLPTDKKSKNGSSSGAEVKAAGTTWEESPASKETSEKPAPRKKRKHSETSAPTTATPSPASTAANDDWVPKSIQETPSPAKGTQVTKRAVEGEVPSTEELLGTSSPSTPPSTETPAPTDKRSRKHRAKSPPLEKPDAEESAAAKTSWDNSASRPASASVSAPTPSAVATPPPARTATAVASPKQAPVQTTPVQTAPAQTAPVPTAEELLAKAGTPMGPDTSESDKWVPKAASKPAVVDVPAQEAAKETMKVAMVPKQAPVDNSVDNLLKMAEQGKGEMPKEGDTWVPKKTVVAKPDVDLNKELQRVQEEEKRKAAPKPKVVLKHDINNPEEGVLPVSSFEKFSGPMYGRHREYERRFYPGKKEKAKVPDHDFYVDEVDRKKEIHNVYYYQHQKGKAPRLVAVERHSRVSFLGNYDIEKEDKGKISSYN